MGLAMRSSFSFYFAGGTEYWYDPAEIDARLYSRGYESNIMDIPVDSFAEMKENGTFIDQMKAVALFLGDVYAEIDCY